MSTTFKMCILSAFCLGVAFIALPQDADPLDPLKVSAQTQRLILENKFVRVIDDQIPVGATEPMHRHRHGVVVYLNTYTNEQTTPDGKKTIQPRQSGVANWSDAVTHSVKNVGNTPSHAIRVELKF